MLYHFQRSFKTLFGRKPHMVTPAAAHTQITDTRMAPKLKNFSIITGTVTSGCKTKILPRFMHFIIQYIILQHFHHTKLNTHNVFFPLNKYLVYYLRAQLRNLTFFFIFRYLIVCAFISRLCRHSHKFKHVCILTSVEILQWKIASESNVENVE